MSILFTEILIKIYKYEKDYGLELLNKFLELLNESSTIKNNNNNITISEGNKKEFKKIWNKKNWIHLEKSQKDVKISEPNEKKWQRGLKISEPIEQEWKRGLKISEPIKQEWKRGLKISEPIKQEWKRGLKISEPIEQEWQRGLKIPLKKNILQLNEENKSKLLFSILTQTKPPNELLNKLYIKFNKYKNSNSENHRKYHIIYKEFLDNITTIKDEKYRIYKDIIDRSNYFIKKRPHINNYDELYEDIKLFFSKERKLENRYTKNINIIQDEEHHVAYTYFCDVYFYKDNENNIRIKKTPYKEYINLEEQLQFQKDNNIKYSDEIINYSFCNKICFLTCEIKGRINYDYLRFIKDNEKNNKLDESIENDRDSYFKIYDLFEIDKLLELDDKNFENLDFLTIIKKINICKTRITDYFENNNDLLLFLKKNVLADNELLRMYMVLLANNGQPTNNISLILWIILISRFYMLHTSVNYEDFVYKIKKYINHILNINLIYISNYINYKKTNETSHDIDTMLRYYNNLFKYILLASYYKFSVIFFKITDNNYIITDSSKIIGKGASGSVYDININGLDNVTKSEAIIHLEKYFEEAYKQHNIYNILKIHNCNNYIPYFTNISVGKTKIFIQMEKIKIISDFKKINNNTNNYKKKGIVILDLLNNIDYVNLDDKDKIDIIIKIIYKTCEMLQKMQLIFKVFVHYDINLSNIFYDISRNDGIYNIDKCYLIDVERTNYCYENLYHLYKSIINDNNNIIKCEVFYKTIDMTYFLYKFTYMFMEKIIKVSTEHNKLHYFKNNILNKIYKNIKKNNEKNNERNTEIIHLIKSNIYHSYSLKRFNNKKTLNIYNNPIYNKYNKKIIESNGIKIIKEYDKLLKPKIINEFIFEKIFSFIKNHEINEYPNIYKDFKNYVTMDTINKFKISSYYPHVSSNFLDIKEYIYIKLFEKHQTYENDINIINNKFIPDNIIEAINQNFKKHDERWIHREIDSVNN